MNSFNTTTFQCSVIVPVYKGARKIRPLLESLTRQTVRKEDFEIIIVDDGSPSSEVDLLSTIVNEFKPYVRIRVLALSTNGGPARARNKGIALAEGSYIFFTDDDCIVPATWIETHLRLYAERPEVSSIGGWYVSDVNDIHTDLYAQFVYLNYAAIFHPINLHAFYGTSDETFPYIASCNTANLSVRKGVFSVMKGFDEDFLVPGSEDLYFTDMLHTQGFISLYIPLFVRHTKKLSSLSFIRFAMNRGLGFFVLQSKRVWSPEGRYTSAFFYTKFMQQVSAISRISLSVHANKRKLLWLGKIYYPLTCSMGLAYPFHRWRWRRRMNARMRRIAAEPFDGRLLS